MIFAKERVEVIANQLKKLMAVQRVRLDQWSVKEGFFLTPEDAQASDIPWERFDSSSMHWHGPDRHYWFRTEFTVPEALQGKNMWLRIRSQLEEGEDARNPQFLVFINGEVVQGADRHHCEIELCRSANAKEAIAVDVQAYSGTMHPEFCLLADVEELSTAIKDLYYDIQLPLWSLSRMKKDAKTTIDFLTVLNETVNLLDLRDVYSKEFYRSVEAARAYIKKELYEAMGGHEDVVATCIGHTHIDVAWLWTVAQTREKAARSFATVLKLMDEYPEYRFMSSQPVLYTFVKERYPALYAKIKERVAKGRWEPEGGMWLEADCNLTSGESLTRQFLYGKKFFKDEFGVDNKVLWLPDVFGYSGALPQIMKKCGIQYFMTTKLSWNQFDKVPNDTLYWEGIDGSKIFTHFISTLGIGQSADSYFTTYNGELHPNAIMGGWERYQNKEINNDILIAFGYGDGGGGPTREMLENGRRMEYGLKDVPKVRQEGVLRYFTELEAKVKDSKRLHTWTGEFYFEYHRGTYTSMARNKRSNRKSELMLMDLELLSVLAEEKGVEYPMEQLEKLWKMVLLNQFHDILPGSSIKEVYEVTKKEYEEIAEKGRKLLQERKAAVAGSGNAITVFNTLGMDRSGLVPLPDGVKALSDENGKPLLSQEINGIWYSHVNDVPSKGYASYAAAEPETADSSVFCIKEQGGGYAVKTPFCEAIIDENGSMASLFDLVNERPVFKAGEAGNLFKIFEDKPLNFDNWDIDIFYREKAWDLENPATLTWTSVGSLCVQLTVERSFMHSKLVQKIRFYANTARIDFDTWVDWHEHQYLLKALFPVDVHTDEATFDIQFGNVTRKTHANTSWDTARFESCAHKWMDVSEGGYGVSLLNDCKYGHSVLDGVIGLTLIKSGIEPNPDTDNEEHFFTYSLYPHKGTWKEAATQAEALDLNTPLTSLQAGEIGRCFSFASVDAANVILETVKRAEDGNGVILRMYESRNIRNKVTVTLHGMLASVSECDLLENEIGACEPEESKFSFTIKPYEIRSFRVVME